MPEKHICGKRICIIGPSCSGKSTLAEKLGEILNYPVLHLDQIAHIPQTNWVERPREETQKDHDAFILCPEWIVDGQYKRLMPQRLERADTLILLESNRFTCLFRYLKRCCAKGDRPGKLRGAEKEFSLKMIKFILYRQPKRWNEQMEIIACYQHLKPVVLRSFKEIDGFIKAIEREKEKG